MSPAPSAPKKKTKPSTTTSTKPERKRRAKESAAPRAIAAEQVDQNVAGPALGARIRARLGPGGARSLMLATRIGSMVVSGLAGYVVAMFAAVTVVPNVFLMVATGTGIGPASPLETQLAHWLAPSLFLIGLIFVLVLVVVRWLWRAQRRLSEKVRRALLGEEVDR
ncbi:hypothetical protein [Nocardiopsis alkaliphila]|uniref:hypothetical protein n=1 Tax=Nocardiopsis alkaliphila TaxID=225762 RepID=UPI000348BD5A|nr:hypothetical protein [Nocardiopsis alkaliphila]